MTPSLLLIHGWGFGPAFWDPLRAALPGVRAEAVDLGYFGPPHVPRIEGPVIAVGHSTGALLALRAPPPDCVALVAINGFDHFVSLEEAPGVAPRLLDRMIARLPEDTAETVGEFRRRCGDNSPFPSPDPARLAEHLALLRTADERPAATAWPLPLLHLSGAADPILPPELRANAFAGAPRLVHNEASDGGHLLPLTHVSWCAERLRGMMDAL